MAKQKERQKDLENEEEVTDEKNAAENVLEEEALSEEETQMEGETAALENELADALVKAEENLDGWQRAQAEFANYRKRMERDRIQQHQDLTAEIISRYLDVVDDLDLALKNHPADGESGDWAEGIELIYRKLMTILEKEGVAPMKALGETFDPNLHEAISQDESPDHESGQIIEVLKEGYLIGERVLRPSLVRIAS
jgi:molecular chaperone GrpE